MSNDRSSDHADLTPATPSHPPATPTLAEAISQASESLVYHEKRMGKRLRRLKGEPPFPIDEETTGIIALPDPFPPPSEHRKS